MTRRLPLRSRLALLTAVAVAIAIAVCAMAAWWMVRHQLVRQLDLSLSAGPGGRPPPGENPCDLREPPDGRFRIFLPTVQVVASDGNHCTSSWMTPINITAADLAVAGGRRPNVYRDGTANDGTHMRVLTRPLMPGSAISIAKPMTAVDDALGDLTLALVAVAAVGVVGAATAGLLIARAGLAPVDRLTGVVEHIARTEDLSTKIPAEGDDEVARLSRSFNTMTLALAKSRERQQRLVADAGHELRTPLTSMRTNIDLMLRSETSGRELPAGRRGKLLTSVQAQLLELSSLVEDLLVLSRPAGTKPTEPREVVALHDAVSDAARRARLRGPGLTIVTDLEPWYVHGDSASIERAVMNLLDNAVKFSPSGGVVAVRLRGGELTVRDKGPGVPVEDVPYVFDRFWRSPTARGLPGSGLGLAIVSRVVQEAGGEVSLGPADGGGAIVRMRLPGSAEPFS